MLVWLSDKRKAGLVALVLFPILSGSVMPVNALEVQEHLEGGPGRFSYERRSGAADYRGDRRLEETWHSESRSLSLFR